MMAMMQERVSDRRTKQEQKEESAVVCFDSMYCCN